MEKQILPNKTTYKMLRSFAVIIHRITHLDNDAKRLERYRDLGFAVQDAMSKFPKDDVIKWSKEENRGISDD